jgi:hypothetical protein
MMVKNIALIIGFIGLFLNAPNARAESNGCGVMENATDLGDGTAISRGYSLNGCTQMTAANLTITQNGKTVATIASPMMLDVSVHSLKVPAQSNCTTRFEPTLRAYALSKLSDISQQNLNASDLPLCSQVILPSGFAYVVYRGFLQDNTCNFINNTSALVSAIEFDPATGDILQTSEDASSI